MTVPNKPGLWLRHERNRLPTVVRVHENVNVYDGPRLPLGWRSGDFDEDFDSPRDDGCWIREVKLDDVPLNDVQAKIGHAVAAERAKIVQYLRTRAEGCEAASSAQFHDSSNIPRYRIAAEVLAAAADAIEGGEVP